VTALVYGPFFLVRWAYYGWPLPNTFYAKVGASGAQVGRGVDYLVDALWPLAPFLASLLVLGPFAWTAWQRFRGLGVLAGAVAAHALYVVAVGGDVMPAFRFLAGVLPVLGLLAGVALSLLPRGGGVGRGAAGGGFRGLAVGPFIPT
jgi:arabinofuranosyltransferase